MLIDWFTVGAQALNFMLLVWLMKRFLYKPILHAIDEREKRIAAQLAAADAKDAEAQKERDAFRLKNEELDQNRATLLRQATDEATAERQRLIEEARKVADALSAKRRAALSDEAHHLHQAFSHSTQKEVFAITRKVLTDLGTASLEERVSDVFVRRLRALNGVAKEALGTALATASDPAIVRSAFELPASQRADIQQALKETFSAEVGVRFEAAPELVSGIELSANGQKLAWSIADYLTSLEQTVGELLNKPARPEPAPDTTPGTRPGVEPHGHPA